MDPIDVLILFQDHMIQLDKQFRLDVIERSKLEKTRADRKARDEFKELLLEYSVSNLSSSNAITSSRNRNDLKSTDYKEYKDYKNYIDIYYSLYILFFVAIVKYLAYYV